MNSLKRPQDVYYWQGPCEDHALTDCMTGLEFSPCRWNCVRSEHAASLEALAELYWRGSQVQQKVSSDIDSIDTELVRAPSSSS